MNNLKKTLIINAHPVSDSTSSVALMGLQHFLETYNEQKADDEMIETISLYDVEIPTLTRTVFSNATIKCKKRTQKYVLILHGSFCQLLI